MKDLNEKDDIYFIETKKQKYVKHVNNLRYLLSGTSL